MQISQFAGIAQNYAVRVSDFVRQPLLPSTASRDSYGLYARERLAP
jgi:hypothetical protein